MGDIQDGVKGSFFLRTIMAIFTFIDDFFGVRGVLVPENVAELGHMLFVKVEIEELEGRDGNE